MYKQYLVKQLQLNTEQKLQYLTVEIMCYKEQKQTNKHIF